MQPAAVPPRLNPDRLRSIDYWLGVPLCFLLTLVSRVAGAFCVGSNARG